MSQSVQAGSWIRSKADAVVLAVLLIARLRIDSLADALVLPLRMADVARHPGLGRLLTDDAEALLAQQEVIDPIGLLLVVAALALLLVYLLAAEFIRSERASYRVRRALLWAVVVVAVLAPALKMILLRQQSGPASYSHDGGVIQTEAAIDLLLDGKNPYVEDYTATPMAEWGISEFRSALYHYPYLPWTFLFSAPFQWLSRSVLGWYDQRFVYLILFVLTLILGPRLARPGQGRLILFTLLALNPIMGSDLIYGQNDSFILAWLVVSFWLYAKGRQHPNERRWVWGSAAAFGLACASKPTAWFLAPFYLVLLAGEGPSSGLTWGAWLKLALQRCWPTVAVVLLIVGPYAVLSPYALYDDVWKWSSGTSEQAYQIWGWGGSNLLLALGWVKSRFDYWPFWIAELLVATPLLVLLVRRQFAQNTLARAVWSYALLLFAFFFVSRFLNENYLGYILAFVGLGALAQPEDSEAG